MNKRIQTQYIVVLEMLKANGCVRRYSIVHDDVKVEWNEGGAERVTQEVTTNPKPFGLKRGLRGLLLLLLPIIEQEKADAILLADFKQRYGLPPEH